VVRYAAATGSTNDDAKDAVRLGCPDRTIILADFQWAGKGRQGRTWVAPAGTSLLVSLVFRCALAPIDLTAVCAVSVAEAIDAMTGLPARVKWPNDVMVGERKVCGILAEVVAAQGGQAVVVGIGLNVNLDPISAGLPPTATSLSAELGRGCSREAILVAILARADRYLSMQPGELVPVVRERWDALLWRKNQHVQVGDGSGWIEGTVEGVGPSGALRVRTPDGSAVEISVGEIVM
jgi:BirA family biotin operon repressor/biotin-[acetyl-CoA-carboxylase] ligase